MRFPTTPGGPIGLPGIVSPGGSRKEMIGGCGNCVEFLLYLWKCRCETGTCRRRDPGGCWERGAWCSVWAELEVI